jgi:hypothetical protein
MDDLDAELAVRALLTALHPFSLTRRVLEQRVQSPNRIRQLELFAAQHRRRQARVPEQRSRTSAEQEDRVFNHFPRSPSRSDIDNQRGGRA